MLTRPDDTLPAGFREDVAGASGLIVPTELSRVREVLTQAEWRKVKSLVEHVCRPHNVKFVWMCNDQKCAHDSIMKRIRTAHGFILQCQHRSLVYDPKI